MHTRAGEGKTEYRDQRRSQSGCGRKIAGEEMLESLIADDKLDYFELKKREHDFLYERALKLAEEKLIGAEAKKPVSRFRSSSRKM